MVDLYDNETGVLIGSISDEELQFLIDELEEESLEDQDYYLNRATLEMLENTGGHPGLVDMIRKAMGDREGIEIRWSRP